MLYCILTTLHIVALCRATATTYNPITHSSLASALSSECVSVISASLPTIASYATSICQVCQGLSISPSVEPCCAAANPTACFASDFYGISVSDASSSRVFTQPLGNCNSAISIYTSCQAKTPGFDNLCFHDQQSCYCSTSGTFAPSYYDNFWSNCLAYLSTADPSSYSQIALNAAGTAQSRKCQTWYDLTKTGGTPSNCMTSAAASLSSPTSLASVGHASPTSTSSNAGNRAFMGQVSALAPKHRQQDNNIQLSSKLWSCLSPSWRLSRCDEYSRWDLRKEVSFERKVPADTRDLVNGEVCVQDNEVDCNLESFACTCSSPYVHHV